MKSILLSPFSLLYGAIVKTRHALYKKGVFESVDLGKKTISVGNITAGGTGKTPLVAFIAEILAEQGEKVCILTRGYGRENPKKRVLVSDGERVFADAREAGDEPFELAKKLLGKALVVADANRAEAGKWMREEFCVTAFILDDGFQHLRVKRDLDIVLIDTTNPFGNGKLLPSGILREPLKNLKRADVIVITRANLVKDAAKIKSQILELNPNGKIFVSENKFTSFTKLKNFFAQSTQTPNSELQTLNSLAFCALGNPENFFEQLKNENFNLVAAKAFPDHHIYKQSEIKYIEKEAIKNGAEVLLTTAKDAVKLKHLRFNFPCFVAENGLIFDDERGFRELILDGK